jgi:multiple sugar transport system substrate-binding protein
MKKYLAAILACTLSATMILSSCGNSDSDSNASGDSGEGKASTVRYLAPANDAQRETFDGFFEDIKEKMNITVEAEYVTNWDEFNQKFMTQLSAKNAPDVVDVSVTYKDQFINSGYLYDIAPLAEENNFDFSKYYDAHFEGFRRGDALYGMPNGTTLMAIYYNKNILDEAGIPYPSEKWEEAPTWDEFYELVAQLSTGEGANRQYGFATSFDICWMFPLFWQNGADFVNEDGSASAMNTPEAIETLEYINKLMFKDEYSPSLSTLKTLPPNELFKSGRVAFYMDGNWYMDSMADIEAFEWGVCPLPQNDEVVTGMYIDAWCVTADSKNPEAAYKVVEYFMSEDALKNKSAKGIPSMISVAEEEVDNLYSYLDEAGRAAWSGALEVGRTPTYTENWAQVVAEANKALEKMSLGELTPEETAAEIEKSTNALLS